ncbi:putative pre-mRNA-splicing factor ATP-dependent RNA helicase DHX32 [Sinocyclocheilus rhinocerous]|uniref:putative pre-mRNA-splicing factor ATP-dependent RNA helicase DHX32 n=1 Tax=Sinocyclocheilus rhinocerous TaxID=307959 RepID=UPI0007B7DC4F|nr:PREDICTED: putative pre-mRNA-splicing factor ATP-dependent RNA helicase DHX32 [Sinocyclocheilus rhinocerous]
MTCVQLLIMAGNSEISEGELKREEESDLFEFGDDLELNQFDGLPYSSRYYRLLQERKTLPVWKYRHEFMTLLENNQILLVSGTTKTGKSTQIPQWCAEFCLSAQYQHGAVVCSQIQRRQAVDLALRVADEMDVNIGHEIGYSIPLETCCSNDTILRFCTDDVLLREMMSDPMLEHYGVVVIDQAHERTVSTDVLLGLLREVLLQRPKLRVAVLSAPPASDTLLAHYGNVPCLHLDAPCAGEVIHSNSSSAESFYSALRLALEVHRSREPGDVAVFLASEQVRSDLPLDPQMAKALLASCEFDCASEMLTIAAMLTAPSCFIEPPVGMVTEVMRCHVKFQHPEGDHFTLINIYNTFKRSQKEPYFSQEQWCEEYFLCCDALQTSDAIRAQLTDILKRIELPISEPAFGTKTNALNIKRALLAGYFMQIARDVDGSGNYFMLLNKHVAQVHRLSGYGAKAHKLGLPEWVLFHEYNLSDNNCIRTVTQISPQAFLQMVPQYFFCNLPPSESTEILQHILDRDRTGNARTKPQPAAIETKTEEAESHDRCVVQ